MTGLRRQRFLAAFVGAALAALAIAPAASSAHGQPRTVQAVGGVFLSLLAVANDDSVNVQGDRTSTVPAPGVLANDLRLELLGAGSRAVLVTDVGRGDLELQADGGLVYTPDSGYVGQDSFSYHVVGDLLSSNTATVTITVSAPAATPAPTPAPTASPTPTLPLPTLTPLPTLPLPTPTLALPTLTPTPTPRVTPTPGATATPGATPTPGANATPGATATPGASGQPRAGTTTSPSPASGANPTPTPGAASTDGAGTGAGGTGGGDGGAGLAAPGDRFLLPAVDPAGIDAVIDASFVGFGGIEWAVPAFALGVPGLLLMIAVGAQTIVGIAWLPFVRRWLGGIGMRRRVRA